MSYNITHGAGGVYPIEVLFESNNSKENCKLPKN